MMIDPFGLGVEEPPESGGFEVPGAPGGALCPTRLRWLDRTLRASDRPTVIAQHHPPFATGLTIMDRMGLADPDAEAAVIARYPHVERVISVAAFPDGGVAHADLVLARTVWGEEGGSTTNLEGRVMRLGRKVTPEGTTMEAWRIAETVLAKDEPAITYPRGSWGPFEADDLLGGDWEWLTR